MLGKCKQYTVQFRNVSVKLRFTGKIKIHTQQTCKICTSEVMLRLFAHCGCATIQDPGEVDMTYSSNTRDNFMADKFFV